MKASYRRKGFTLVELLIVIVVIGVLSTMMMLASDEAVSSAKATTIINNLQILKRATLAWYMDNLDKVVMTTKTGYKVGMVTINGKTSPIQEWGDANLHISNYISNVGATGINFNTKATVKYADGTTNTNTSMAPGYYGICDGGGQADKRHMWYVGYCFKPDEARVREKIIAHKNTQGLMLGTADAHENKNEDNSAAVWMLVLNLK